MCWYKRVERVIGVACLFPKFRGSIVVSIPACHAGDPGSIPGPGVLFLLVNPPAQQKGLGSTGT